MGTAVLEAFLRDVVSHVADRASAREQHSFHTWKTYQTALPPTLFLGNQQTERV
jgi:hypothetical protein